HGGDRGCSADYRHVRHPAHRGRGVLSMTPEVLIAVVGVFVAVSAIVGTTASWALARNAPERRRLRSLGQAQSTGLVIETPRLTTTLDPNLARLSRFVPKSPRQMSLLQRRLTQAGYPSFSAVVVYSAAEVILPAFFFLVVVIVLGLRA